MVEDAAANVLANHEILMSSPSAAKLNSFYPSPSESSSTIAQAVDNSGQLRIQANSKQIGGASDFLISTPNLLDCPQLNLSFTVKGIPTPQASSTPPNTGFDQRLRMYMCTYHDGWGFDCIDRIEMSVAKSNISNLQLQGHALRDWSLLQCKNADERQQMLKIAGKGQTWTMEKDMTLEASIPLSFLFFRSAGGVKGGFPIDGRALHGPITFQIYFKPIQYFCGPAASVYDRYIVDNIYDQATGSNTATFPASVIPGQFLPTQFDRLEFTARTYQLMDGIFSVSKALESNPSLTYSIPSLWLNTYSQQVHVDNKGIGKLNINSIPAGMLQAIIVRARPVNPTAYYNVDLTGTDQAANDAVRLGDYQFMLNYDPPNYNNVTRPPSAGGYGYQTGVTAAYRPYVPWSLGMKSLRLEYSGQAIYSATSASSHDNFTRNTFCDDLKTKVCGLPLTQTVVGQVSQSFDRFIQSNSYANGNSTATAVENLGDRAMVEHDTQVIVIPLCHDADSIFRKRDFENLPHYSGSTLQLEFQVEPFNTYTTQGLDRRMCYKDGAQSGFDPDTQQDLATYDGFEDLKRWRPELPSTGCATLPSNRLQHVAVATGPVNRDVSANTINEPPASATTNAAIEDFTQLREKVLFNNNPSSEGATAFLEGGQGGLIQLDLTYVIASLFQITNGTSELQL